MSEQPYALRLAELLESFSKSSHRLEDGTPLHTAIAAELRRLHAENAELSRALEASGKVSRALVEVMDGNDARVGIPQRD